MRHKNTIAGRVALAVSRIDIDPAFIAAEGIAYKCAFEDMGSPALKHCAAATADAAVMRYLAVAPRWSATHALKAYAEVFNTKRPDPEQYTYSECVK